MDKSFLKQQLLEALDQQIDAAMAAAQQAQQAASHEDNQPENQYDTLSLEAAYLAHGQSERILQLQQQRITLARWQVTDFTADDVVASGALVVLQPQDEQQPQRLIWITPLGGLQLSQRGCLIQVISNETPLAARLRGLTVGDELELPGQAGCWELVSLV